MREKKPLTKDVALLRMADLCARSEQCASEIMTKLRAKGLSAQDICDIIDNLTARGFIDERRYARSFTRDKVRFAGWGRLKIRAMLAARRISPGAMSEAMDEIDPEEYADALARVAKSKAHGLDLRVYDDRMRLLRQLATRGFEIDLAKAEIKRLMGMSR